MCAINQKSVKLLALLTYIISVLTNYEYLHIHQQRLKSNVVNLIYEDISSRREWWTDGILCRNMSSTLGVSTVSRMLLGNCVVHRWASSWIRKIRLALWPTSSCFTGAGGAVPGELHYIITSENMLKDGPWSWSVIHRRRSREMSGIWLPVTHGACKI